VSSGKSLHRIDENIVKREVEAAGFKLVAEGDFLRHPEDKRDTLSSRARGVHIQQEVGGARRLVIELDAVAQAHAAAGDLPRMEMHDFGYL
jgi:predicted methyltransferase